MEKMLLGNKGTEGIFCWEQGNMDPRGGPSLTGKLYIAGK